VNAKAKPAKDPSRRSRGSLSESEILAAAIALAERDGLENLSMPNLAKHLGAGAMSIYWYFHSKDDLLGAMTEHTMRELYARLPPVGGGPWNEEILRLTSVFRTELRRTPLFAQLCGARPRFLFSRPNVMPVLATRIDQELQLLQGLGVSAVDAMRLHNILSALALGFVLMQIGTQPSDDEQSTEDAVSAAVAHLDRDEFPTLRSIGDVGALASLRDDDFDYFLRLLVAGMPSEFPGRQ
jgi:AcrR family transcriptional regulator